MAHGRRIGVLALALCLLACAAAGRADAQTGAPFVEWVSAGTLPGSPTTIEWGQSSTACAASYCASVGFAADPGGHARALVMTSSNGVAGPSQWATLPNGANATAPDAQLNGVSCWSDSSCVAVGYYTDSAKSYEGLVVPIIDGVVQPGIIAPLPTDASSTPYAVLYGVSCATGGACEAVGAYTRAAGGSPSIVLPIADGVPGAAQVVSLPGNSITPEHSVPQSVSCWTAGNCEAVGSYSVADGAQPMAVAISGGVPGPAVGVARPTGSASAVLSHVSCWAAGSCAAVGAYVNNHALDVPLAALISDGVPGNGVPIALPAAAASSTYTVELNQVACAATGSCAAVGYYNADSTNSDAFDVPIQNGTIGSGEDVSLPQDASLAPRQASLNDISCPPSGPCLGVGTYRNTAGKFAPMTLTLSGGTLSAATTAPAPPDGSTSTPSAGLDSVGCGSSGSCAAFGNFSLSDTVTPYVLSAQAPLTVATTSLPAGSVASAYSQTLSATGAWGAYGWSVTSGSLPAGLSLNAQSGVISGTPTAAGSSTFAVQATAIGSPLQTATQSLTLSIAAAPVVAAPGVLPIAAPPVGVPKLSLVGSSAVARRNRFGLRMLCAGAACQGLVRVSISQVVTVRHGKRRVHRHRTVLIGSAHFSLAAGAAGTVSATLNGAGRRALAAHHRISATVVATIGGTTQDLGHLTLRTVSKDKRKR